MNLEKSAAMRRTDLATIPLLAALTLLASIALTRASRAQDDINEDVVEAAVPVQPQFMIAEENFNMWVYGNSRDAKTARTRLETQIKLQIDEVASVARLTDTQKKKLELAGKGDVKRFFDLVEDKRKGFKAVQNDQNKFNEFYQELRTIQLKLNAGLYGPDSFYAKTLNHTLDPDQTASFNQVVLERERFRYRAQIGQVVANLDNSIGLKADQRRQLLKLIAEETRPPKKSSQYDSYVVLYQLSRLPDERIKPLFANESQWQAFKRQMTNSKNLERFLIQQGILPDEFPDGQKAFAAEPKAK